jgi:hypothetical protein
MMKGEAADRGSLLCSVSKGNWFKGAQMTSSCNKKGALVSVYRKKLVVWVIFDPGIPSLGTTRIMPNDK